jgi:hypothetical protein
MTATRPDPVAASLAEVTTVPMIEWAGFIAAAAREGYVLVNADMLAEALRTYEPPPAFIDGVMARRNWSRPDPRDAAAILAALEGQS